MNKESTYEYLANKEHLTCLSNKSDARLDKGYKRP